MIKIILHQRLIRSAKSLNPEQRAALNAILAKVGQNFGDPHKHGGLGLRKVGADLWECRLDLRLRVVFSLEAKGLGAYDIMNHDEVRVWLKKNR